MNKDKAGGRPVGRRIEVETGPFTLRIGQVERARPRGPCGRRGSIALLDQRRAVRNRIVVVVGRVARGLVEVGPYEPRVASLGDKVECGQRALRSAASARLVVRF